MIKFVTNPDDPLITPLLSDLLKKVIPEEFTEELLDRGLIRYTIFSTNSSDDDINELVEKIAYQPISITITNQNFNKNLNGLIKVFTERIIKTEISNVEIVRFQDYVVYNPILKGYYGTSVYENPSYLAEFHRILNLDYIGNYQILSENPISKYVISREGIKDVIFVDGVALIPIGNNINEINHYTDIVNEIVTMINNEQRGGTFSYSVDIHNQEDSIYVKQLAKSWNTEILFESEDTLVMKTNIEFGMNAETWFRNNLELIKNKQQPVITLYGDWQFKVGGDYNDIYDKKWYSSIIYYCALLAYKLLGNDSFQNKLMQNIVTTRVNHDNSITLSLPSYDYIDRFKKEFTSIINENEIYAEPCADLTDGIIKRYYIQTIDDKAYPMVLKQSYDDNSTEEILVFRSPLLNNYPSVFDFSIIDKKEITVKIKEYYDVCHDNYEPVILEEIKNLALIDLLSLIEITENGITYCYTRDTVINLSEQKNPLTRQPLNENILMKALLMEQGLRGFFDVGPLKGLVEL